MSGTRPAATPPGVGGVAAGVGVSDCVCINFSCLLTAVRRPCRRYPQAVLRVLLRQEGR